MENTERTNSKFHQLLRQLEKEYELVCAENAALKEIIISTSERSREIVLNPSTQIVNQNINDQSSIPTSTSALIAGSKQVSTGSPQQQQQLNKQQLNKRDSMANASHLLTNKLKSKYRIKSASTRIFRGSSAQTPNSSNKLIRQFEWHKDGVWYVTASCVRNNRILIGSASADGTACIADATRFINDYMLRSTSNSHDFFSSSSFASASASSPGPLSGGGGDLQFMSNSGPLSSPSSQIQGALNDSKNQDQQNQQDYQQQQQQQNSGTAKFMGKLPHILYAGHSGSVNCIRFHPGHDLVLTASGDGTAHIWRCPPASLMESLAASATSRNNSQDDPSTDLSSGGTIGGVASSSSNVGQSSYTNDFDGHLNPPMDYGNQIESSAKTTHVIRQPLKELTGHSSTVVSCDWLASLDQCVTASWDRTACVYDIKTGELINQLAGHDQELTHVCAHTSAPLIVTASEDTTFRLWDFREAIHSVCVFQGHTESVTSATFFGHDKIISASDDRTCKIWDLRNMRSPLTTIYVEAPINKISVSQSHNLIALPLDNRNVRFYDITGQRLNRLPRTHHQRMATCTAFIPIPASFVANNPGIGGGASGSGAGGVGSSVGNNSESSTAPSSLQQQQSTSSSASPTAKVSSDGGANLQSGATSGSNATASGAIPNNLFLLTCGFDKRVAMWSVPTHSF